MESVEVKRLDHHGIVAGVIDDLQLVEIVDQAIPPDPQEEVTNGEALKAMIMNGLGFTNRPLSLTPQFFTNLPLQELIGKNITPEKLNRHKLGRSLDDFYDYGPEPLFSQMSGHACHIEEVQTILNSLDTSSFSVTGQGYEDTDEYAVVLTHGYSKDHRPDLKQVVLEMMVSQDGGIPLIVKSWDGNASDNTVFRERAKALMEQFQNAEGFRILIGDSKTYSEESVPVLRSIPFITRIPGTFKAENAVIQQALRQKDSWISINEDHAYQCFHLCHLGMEQRWVVIHSQGALARAKKTVGKRQNKELKKIEKQLFHLQAKRFDSKEEAVQALTDLQSSWKYHNLQDYRFTEHKRYTKRGKPGPNNPVKKIQWQIHAEVDPSKQAIEQFQEQKACFVIGTNILDDGYSDTDIFFAYRGQSSVERGFRFLKDKAFFVSSLFLEKPSRIEALLMVMTTALLVYSIAQRRLRQRLKEQEESIPNQINQPTQRPTLKWVFQLFEGINLIKLYFQCGEPEKTYVDNLNDLRIKIIRLLGENVCRKYMVRPSSAYG